MREISDAWQQGFETASITVRKLADKELATLRAENERLRALLSGWLELSESHPIGLEVVDRGHVTKDVCRYNPDVVLKYSEAIARTREALKESKP